MTVIVPVKMLECRGVYSLNESAQWEKKLLQLLILIMKLTFGRSEFANLSRRAEDS